MIKRRSVLTRKTSCPVCSKKRIKCDRLVPCTNCLNKGLENECLTSTFSRSTVESTIESHILSLYQNWDHWIVKEACFNGMLCMMHVPFINENNLLDDSLIRLVDEDNSFKILDFAMSNLGFMFFGYFADITEFYLLLEKYWEPKKYHGLSLDDMFTETLLWSIFSMSVYYMNQRELENLFGDEDLEKIYKCFLYYTLELIKNILHIPDVRIIQAFLILSNTDFRYRYPMYYHHLFCTVQHISSTINLNNIKPFSFENSFLSYKLIKDSCDKMWFQLLYWDYLTESIKRPINLHYNFKSLVLQEQQDVFPKNIENVENNPELYKVEETFELLLWKFVSLDRDMEQYVNKKASMKSIDAIEKEIILLDTKRKIYIKNLSSNSKNDLFQKFIYVTILKKS
ncbi:Cep3p SCDLUD_002693 [Saccharomycodes ludwigii]|uniref:Cep3p n=1 Tax=Saccharomycodes ludwigii TaxID=36035 RepID=UPI001E89BCAD|nr:hypothetical protein SCDLUD_002693 [Saccharomycodes ludwigii]KAH3901207.1 hypothetical protein SCDLUD_002693 [Saccharomycodes ludwigii]